MGNSRKAEKTAEARLKKLEETGKTAEQHLMDILGIDEQEMRKIREKQEEKRKEAYNLARKVLQDNNIAPESIPKEVLVRVAADAVLREMDGLERQATFAKNINREVTDLTGDEASSLILAKDAYDRIGLFLGQENVLSAADNARLDKAVKKAGEICRDRNIRYSNLTMGVVAWSIPSYETSVFTNVKPVTVESASRLVAAYMVRNLILRLYEPYNVVAAEALLMDLVRYNLYKTCKDLPETLLLATIPNLVRNNVGLYAAAAEEIDNVMNHTEEVFGYRLNYISSGRKAFDVFKWKGEADEISNAGYPLGTIWTEDKGVFPTLEEAKSIADEDDEITEYDPDEMWAIVDANGENPTKMIYPTKERAAVFLLGLLGKERVPNWYALEEYLAAHEEESA